MCLKKRIIYRFFLGLIAKAQADVDAKNLQLFMVRQMDFLIQKVETGYPYGMEASNIIHKVLEDLDELSTNINAPLKEQDFARIGENLKKAAFFGKKPSVLNANVKLQEAWLLLRSFAF